MDLRASTKAAAAVEPASKGRSHHRGEQEQGIAEAVLSLRRRKKDREEEHMKEEEDGDGDGGDGGD